MSRRYSPLVLSAYQLKKSKQEVSLLRKKQAHLKREIEKDFSICHCQSAAMMELDVMVRKVAVTDASVLILGENGTGKEVIAREIHRQSDRRNLKRYISAGDTITSYFLLPYSY